MKNYPPTKADQKPGFEPMAFSVADAVAITGLGRTTLYTLMDSGQLGYCKIGKRRMIRRSDIQALFAIPGRPVARTARVA